MPDIKPPLVLTGTHYIVTFSDDGEDIEIEKAPRGLNDHTVYIFVDKAQLVAWLMSGVESPT